MNNQQVWPLILILALICGGVAAAIWRSKGGVPKEAFLYGVLLGPIGIIIALVRTPEAAHQVNVCPHCRERVHPEATVCPHCQREIPIGSRASARPAFRSFADITREREEKKQARREKKKSPPPK